MFDPAIGKRMVKGGRKIQEKQGGPEDGKPHHAPGIPVVTGIKNQANQSDEGQTRADTMGYTIGDFLDKALLGWFFFPAPCRFLPVHSYPF